MATSHACSEGPWRLPIFSALSPVSPIPRSLSDRHTFLKIDLGSAATVTRSALGKRKREASDFYRFRPEFVSRTLLACLQRRKREKRVFFSFLPLLYSFPSFSCLFQRHLSLCLSGYLPVWVYLLYCSYFILPASLWTFAAPIVMGYKPNLVNQENGKKDTHFYNFLFFARNKILSVPFIIFLLAVVYYQKFHQKKRERERGK